MVMRWIRTLAILLSGTTGIVSTPGLAVTLTGEVYVHTAQPIFVPPSESQPVVLRYFVGDGVTVGVGDVVLRTDVGEAEGKRRTLRDEREKAISTAAVKQAGLRIKVLDAEEKVIEAEAERDKAALDAALPTFLLSKLDVVRFRGAKAEADATLAFAKRALGTARQDLERQAKDTQLQMDIYEVQEAAINRQLQDAVVLAKVPGIVTHRFDSVIGDGRRYDEGGSSYTGVTVGDVVGSGAVGIHAWVFEADRWQVKVGQKVWLAFDAFPGHTTTGHIQSIAGGAEAKKEWGNGRYFSMEIAMEGHADWLKSGLSARVDTTPPPVEPPTRADRQRLSVPGEVMFGQGVSIVPPEVEGLWDMTITWLLQDGQMVHRGDSLVSFEGGEVHRRLEQLRSDLLEQRQLQLKERLELADDARTQALALAKALGDLEKATRKAERIGSVLPEIEVRKLLIDKTRSERAMALARKMSEACASERAAKQRVADTRIKALERDIAAREKEVASLTITASQDGIFIHSLGWDGRKLENGAKISRTKSVGNIPDMKSLYVLASVPERHLGAIAVGRAARIIQGGDATHSFKGTITRVGDVAHSRSAVQPLPVVDFQVRVADDAGNLLPGEPVTVEVLQ